MPAVGSVSKTGLSSGTQTATMPLPNLTIVGIAFNGTCLSIPIDQSRSAFFINTGQSTAGGMSVKKWHNVTFQVSGTTLNFQTYDAAVTNATFYFGTPGEGQLPLAAYSAVRATVTLSSGTGTATLSFPSGNLTLVGISATDVTTAAKDITLNWNTSSGQSMTVYLPALTLSDEIVPTSLAVSVSLSVTVTGNASDVITVIAYYM